MAIESINPATEELIKSFIPVSNDEVEEIIDDVQDAFVKWRETNFSLRKKLMLNHRIIKIFKFFL